MESFQTFQKLRLVIFNIKQYPMKPALRIFFLISLLAWQNPVSDRIRFFPKTVEYVKNIPNPENVWVFMMAGQSNMAGRGMVEPQDTLSDPRIMTINAKGELVYAKEPLHWYEPTRTGLDCGLSFGRTLLKKIPGNISLLILPTAIGGSAIRQWLGDSSYRGVNLMANFKEKVLIGKKYGQIKAILWHQGESDASAERIAVYPEKLNELFTTFRNIIGNKQLLVLMGELGAYSNNAKGWSQINELLHAHASKDKHTSVIKTGDLVHVGDTVHFNSASQRIMGERFAGAFLN